MGVEGDGGAPLRHGRGGGGGGGRTEETAGARKVEVGEETEALQHF